MLASDPSIQDGHFPGWDMTKGTGVVHVAIEPFRSQGLAEAVEAGGGRVVPAEEAEAILWMDPEAPQQLRQLLADSTARWVQLPFAGIENFFADGVIDSSRLWTCAKGIYGRSAAEHALALILATVRSLHVHVKADEWIRWESGSAPNPACARQLADCTVLLIGTGGLGSHLASMLRPLGPQIIGVNRSGKRLLAAHRTEVVEDLLNVLPQADFVVIAAPLTPQTRHMISNRELVAMKPTAWVVNVARGGLINTKDLVEALRAKQIAGAALDVTDPEPLPKDHPLWGFPNVIITPHIANTWEMALPELTSLVQRNVAHFLREEELEALVDPVLGY